MSDQAPDQLFRQGRYDDAAEKLKQGLKEEGEKGRDSLLYLLDLGLTLHTAGKYAESNSYFFRADEIADLKDYTSLATESATLLTTDTIRDYKGEDFEKVLINTYLAMNFALLGDTEGALVEARRVNRKLHLMVTDGQRKYKQNAFARYLSGILYESEDNWNDAYIDYKFTHELIPDFPGIGRDLWRMAFLLGMHDALEKWEEHFKMSAEDVQALKAEFPRRFAQGAQRRAPVKSGEIIVLYQNGISPVKRPDPGFSQIPKFYPRFNPVLSAKVFVDAVESGDTYRLHDIEKTAIENLEEKWGGILARKLGGVVAKEIMAKQVENVTDSPLLGFLARVVFWVSDQADVRSWNLLPKDLQIVRIPVEPGTHVVRVHPVGGGDLPEKKVEVAAGKKVFVNFRYTPP